MYESQYLLAIEHWISTAKSDTILLAPKVYGKPKETCWTDHLSATMVIMVIGYTNSASLTRNKSMAVFAQASLTCLKSLKINIMYSNG